MTSHSQSGDPLPDDSTSSQFGASWDFHAWSDGLSEPQLALQQDLSCLVDGELDEGAAAHAMVLLEDSVECQSFFDDIQRFARLHRDLSDPQRLEARIAMLGSAEIARAAENVDLAHRLATIFYQLGKAYTLSALDPEAFRNRVFEAAVPVDTAKTRGRGFVDGVVDSGRLDGSASEASSDAFDSLMGASSEAWGKREDWVQARHLLNGRLDRIADPLEKGRRLLEQAIEVDPSHEEARIYLAFVHATDGKKLRAAELYREVFDTAISLENRGHAAMQLGPLYFSEGDIRKSLVFLRWVVISGLAGTDARFNVVRFNIGVAYAAGGQTERALDSFRRLMDVHLATGADPTELATLFVQNEDARAIFDRVPGFIERLAQRLPELLSHASASEADSSFDSGTDIGGHPTA